MNRNWSSWTSVALGFWLMIAALIPEFGPGWPARGEDLALGIGVMALASWPALAGRMTRPWAFGLCLAGVWIIYAPLALGYEVATSTLINDIVIGLALIVLNAIVLFSRRPAPSVS